MQSNNVKSIKNNNVLYWLECKSDSPDRPNVEQQVY